jgi:hypothetical protein
MVLFAVVFAIGAMLALNRLPRLNHPLFDDPRFSFAGGDRFFLVVRGGRRDELAVLRPRRIAEVPA